MVFVTYARLPAEELYKVSGSGPLGGASRALVLLSYPLALGFILILTRELRRMRGSTLRTALISTSSLVLVYGLAVVVADFWLEQIVKRGRTDFEITGGS